MDQDTVAALHGMFAAHRCGRLSDDDAVMAIVRIAMQSYFRGKADEGRRHRKDRDLGRGRGQMMR